MECIFELLECHCVFVFFVHESLNAALIMVNAYTVKGKSELKLFDSCESLEYFAFPRSESSSSSRIWLTEMALLATHFIILFLIIILIIIIIRSKIIH